MTKQKCEVYEPEYWQKSKPAKQIKECPICKTLKEVKKDFPLKREELPLSDFDRGFNFCVDVITNL